MEFSMKHKEVTTAPKAVTNPKENLIDAAEAVSKLPIVVGSHLPGAVSLLMCDDQALLAGLLEFVQEQVAYRLPSLPRGVNLTVKQICKPSIWKQSSPENEKLIAQCLFDLARKNVTPLVYAGNAKSGAPKFRRL
jgi:hypothetical protein